MSNVDGWKCGVAAYLEIPMYIVEIVMLASALFVQIAQATD
jgi:hypothetical protein